MGLLHKVKEGDPASECMVLKLSFINFSEYLHSSLNEISLPLEEENYELPLVDYFINASYQPMHYSFSVSRFQIMHNYRDLEEGIQPIAYALLRGAKYIQLDVWNDTMGEPYCIYGHM